MLHEYLTLLSDRRQRGKIQFDLATIVELSIEAIEKGANNYELIHTYIVVWYEKHKNEVAWDRCPKYHAVRKILLCIEEGELEEIFRMYVLSVYASLISQLIHIAIDGKTLRGSGSYGQKAFQMLNCYAPEVGLILGHDWIADGDKTNEIPIVQGLIPTLGISGKILSLDAMHAQHKTIAAILASGNEALIQVKGNQKKLFGACQKTANSSKRQASYTTYDTAHGRSEERVHTLYNSFHPFDCIHKKWPEGRCIIKVTRYVTQKDYITGKKIQTGETCFFLATHRHTIQEFATYIRGHWGIEIQDHFVRDVTYGEDRHKLKTKPQIMAILVSFGMNFVKQCQSATSTFSTPSQRFALALQGV